MNAPFAPPVQPLTQVCQLGAAQFGDSSLAPSVAAFIAAHPLATPFHSPGWVNAIADSTGHPGNWLIARHGDDVAGVLPVHAITSPLFGRALVSTGFAVGGGILCADEAAGRALADAAREAAQRLGMAGIELRGGWLPQATDGWSIQAEAHAGFARSLCADDEAELLAIPRKQRAEVRRGLGYAMDVRTGSSADDRAMHYAVYAQSVRNLGTPVFPRALFAAVLDQLGDDADILTVLADGKPVASVLSLYHCGTVMPFWGGGVADARRLRANDVMYYALMNHARRRGCNAFDFGRSKVDSGAYHFKRNWGFTPEPLSYASWSASGKPPRDTNPNSPRYKAQIALWQKLPLAVANRIGPWIAGGLG